MRQLAEIIRDVFDVSEETFSDDTAFADYETWDSLAHMRLIAGVETAFGIELTGDEIAEMATVGDLREVVQKHMAS